jgi:hypothetical protein
MRSDRGTASPTGDGCGVPRHGAGTVVSTPITAAERHKRMPARGHAASLVLGAARIEAEEADDWRESSRADDYRAQALAPLSGEMIVHGAGGELVPTDSGKGAAEWRLLDTVDNPNYVTADASRGRLDLAQQAGALEEALDAADTIEARDSLERMLAHQLATLHVSAMKMSADLNRRLDYLANVRGEESERVNIQATRLANAVGRLMSTYQQGMMTLQRFRSGGSKPSLCSTSKQIRAVGWSSPARSGEREGYSRGEGPEMTKEPQAPFRCERLDGANAAPRCGARRRDGGSCHGPAMPNGRCRMHGGPSTGPRTPEGLERSRRSNWKHGYYSAKAKRVRRDVRQQYGLLRSREVTRTTFST